MRRPLAAIVACLVALAAAPAPAPAGDAPPADLKALLALCDEWGAAETDEAKLVVEAKAMKLPPIPEAAVKPMADRLLQICAKSGPKLKTKGQGFFYDEKTKKGRYYAAAASSKKLGALMITMHGGGENQGDAGQGFSVFGSAAGEGFNVIAPEVMKKVSSAWNEEPEERMVLEMVEAAKRTWDIDTDRIFFTGHSMGGDASWMLGGRNADILAGCAPLAGSVMPYMKPGAKNKRLTPIAHYEGLMEGVIPNLLHAHYYICHSDDDENEAIHPDDIAVGYLKKLQARFPGKYDFKYDRTTGIKHDLPTGGVGPICKWLAGKTRTTYPDEVVWETWWKWKRQFYWLYEDTHWEAWRYHAKVAAPNHVDVSATVKLYTAKPTPPERLPLTILCSPKMFDFGKPLKVTRGQETLFEGPIQRTAWSVLVSVGRRNDPKQWFEGHVSVTVPRDPWTDFWDEAVTPK
jgi:hypothetical protein